MITAGTAMARMAIPISGRMAELIYLLVSQSASLVDLLMSRPLDIGEVIWVLSRIRDRAEVLGALWMKPRAR